jgi:hypothetical protein
MKLKNVKIKFFVMIWNFDRFSRWNIESIWNLHTFKILYLLNND